MSKKSKTKKKNVFIYYDWNIVYLVLFACAMGLIIIYSASAYIAKSKNLESTYFFRRQLEAIGVGLFLMLCFSLNNYKKLLKSFKIPFPKFIRNATNIEYFILSKPGVMLFGMTLLQAYTSFFTPVNNGARRWLNIGIMRFQPSELAKFVVIIFGAYTCAKVSRDKVKFSKLFLDIFAVTPLIIFIAVENLSAGIIVSGIYGLILFTNSKWISPYILLGALAVVSAYLYVTFTGGYRSTRLEIWENVENSEKGQQILQGLYAIASGGLFGKGPGGSEQKYGRVPEAYNDMIFTIICEEFGIFGGIAIIVIFALILHRMWIVIMNARDRFGALLGVGIMSQIGIQVILNVLVVTSVIPSTGVILPFISFGGSGIVFMLIEIGIFLNISWQIKYINRLSPRNI
ncbi:MAG: FtsW/RodA/SpoVE family cell cycle protein [Catonella sp.]|uniref:FtsW/RodA/SpoVE family cell cycle protein n=1 Tax=Catonella sp. TaxID=2382125 RepID=UPI003F9F9E7E